MNLFGQLENYSQQVQRLKQEAKCSACKGFADLCWDDVDPFVLEQNPGIKFETSNRVVAFQYINGEIRYYAGGWGTQESIDTEPNEFGVFSNLSDALSFSED